MQRRDFLKYVAGLLPLGLIAGCCNHGEVEIPDLNLPPDLPDSEVIESVDGFDVGDLVKITYSHPRYNMSQLCHLDGSIGQIKMFHYKVLGGAPGVPIKRHIYCIIEILDGDYKGMNHHILAQNLRIFTQKITG